MTFIQSLSAFVFAVMPLAVLTAASFFRTGTASRDAWQPPGIEEYERIQALADAQIAKDSVAPSNNVSDPLGFSVGGDPAGELALPYQVARALASVEEARKGDDLQAAANAATSLATLIQDRLPSIEALSPNGREVAVRMQQQLKLVKQRCVWLENRAVAQKDLVSAEKAILAGPEIDGEEACLALIAGLKKRLPEVVSAEAIAKEPGDALTVAEAETAGKLVARATFRRDFLKARRDIEAPGLSASDLERVLSELEAFLKTWAQAGAPDQRDTDFLSQGEKLRRVARLKLLRTRAEEQATADGLLAAVAEWLAEAGRDPGDLERERKTAVMLVQRWLSEHVPNVAPLPAIDNGIQEGFTNTTRFVGFFEPVKGTKAQYRWWDWDSTAASREKAPKGEKQFNLKDGPAAARHKRFYADFAKAREAFLSTKTEGFLSATSVSQFRDASDALLSEFVAYRSQWSQPGFPLDVAAQNWDQIFDQARNVVVEFQDAAEKHGLARLLGQ